MFGSFKYYHGAQNHSSGSRLRLKAKEKKALDKFLTVRVDKYKMNFQLGSKKVNGEFCVANKSLHNFAGMLQTRHFHPACRAINDTVEGFKNL